MKTKELILTIIFMLLASTAGVIAYQFLFNAEPNTELNLNNATNKASVKVNTNNIDLATLIAKDFSGTNVDLTEYAGQHLVINFWATWCPPCRKEIPLLKDIQEKYQDQNVQVIGIAMDDADKVEKYMQDIDFNYPSLVTDLTQTTRFSQALNYEFIALPFTFFINQEGKLIQTKTGELKTEELDSILEKLLLK